MTSSGILNLRKVYNLSSEVSCLGLGYIGRLDELVGQHQVHHTHIRRLGFRT
jgi:hypothetical protein